MKVFFAIILILVGLDAGAGLLALLQAPDGIQIGGDVNGRLPILDFDEYVVESGIDVMSAGEIRILEFEDCCENFRVGSNLNVFPLNPDLYNQPKLLILHSWVPENGTVKVIVKNIDSSSVDFGSDQLIIGGWNTANTKRSKK